MGTVPYDKGMNGPENCNHHRETIDLGYSVSVDGDFGPEL